MASRGELQSLVMFLTDEGAWATRVRALVTLMLVILLAEALAGLTWELIRSSPGSGGGGMEVRATRLPALPTKELSGPGPASLPGAEVPLFGRSVRGVDAPAALDAKPAPLTTLNLVLKGVISAMPASRALAVIAEKKKGAPENLYGLGEKVPGEAVLHEIHADRVILRRGGVLETLEIEREEGLTRAVINDKVVVNQGDGIHWQIKKSYLEQRLADIPALVQEIGVEIYKEGEVQKGYRLISARGSKLLIDLGLQPGDVLHEVNGVPLNSVHDGLAAYKQVQEAPDVRLVISRNGRRETRIYNIR